jgi:hypothetical protein
VSGFIILTSSGGQQRGDDRARAGDGPTILLERANRQPRHARRSKSWTSSSANVDRGITVPCITHGWTSLNMVLGWSDSRRPHQVDQKIAHRRNAAQEL